MTNEKKETPVAAVSTENIYRLNGRVPLGKAIPFGLQQKMQIQKRELNIFSQRKMKRSR